MNAFLAIHPFLRCEDLSLMRPALALAGLLLLLAALLWRRTRWRQAGRAPGAGGTPADLHALLQTRKAAPPAKVADSAPPPQAPKAPDTPPFEAARLDAMFGHDRRLQGEILALFVAESRDRLAGIAHALRCERTAPARVLAQEILDGSHAMGLLPLQALARQAMHAGLSNDIGALRRLHAELLVALDALSQAVTALQTADVARTDDCSGVASRP
ncbi:Hpt domain-containing protein [Janthinobacterium sp. PLB04]|uniref:Hpt domain-containing protein n=1 Tax=Janthinobacterium lividum TaxID=29581 RepID=A0AAJ4MN61_9BURK|nr:MULTISPECIES: Hpt domain-containing protein [Janthinobacterium]KAB0324895.1 Hpt domain-containing protein [Janthinobacterium lividum]QSX93985.1 Hpt domain-containing protein [Janthinobacterium lividum]UGQ33744.1 Hpt domain-containing protein [Janthinobacterium sp. PLB04]